MHGRHLAVAPPVSVQDWRTRVFTAPDVQAALVPSPVHRSPMKTLLIHFSDKYAQSSVYNHFIACCTGFGPFVHCNLILSDTIDATPDGRLRFIVNHEGGGWCTYVGEFFKRRSVYCGSLNSGRESAIFAIPLTHEMHARLTWWLNQARGIQYSTNSELARCALPDDGKNPVLPYVGFTGRPPHRSNIPDQELFVRTIRDRMFCSEAIVLALQYSGILPDLMENVRAERVSPNRLFRLVATSSDNVRRIEPDQLLVDLPRMPNTRKMACPGTVGVWVA